MKLSFKFQPKLTQEQLSIIEELSFHTSKLYNIANYECREKEFKSYLKLEKELKSNWHSKFLHSHTYQQGLKVLEQDWKSFFASSKDFKKHPEKYKGMPKPPKYKNLSDRKNQVIFTNLAIRFKENTLMLSLSKTVQAKFNVNSLNFELPDAVQKQLNLAELQQVKITWEQASKAWVLFIIYKITDVSKTEGSNLMAIDLGIDNLCAMTFKDNAEQILISGKTLKSRNAYFNKEIARLTSIAIKQCGNAKHFKRSKALIRLQKKRNDYVMNTLHKASRYVVNLATTHHCSAIIIGDLKDIKQNLKIKSFVQIPLRKLVKQIQYKAKLVGIQVVFTKEYYTSGVSALDLEPLTKAYYNKARRIERGLFRSNNGLILNADINGSLNIMRRYDQNVVPELVNLARDNGFLSNPIRIRVA